MYFKNTAFPEVERIFQAFAEERKRELSQFTPDGIPITLENKFDDAIYNYLYKYWKTNSGEYDPKDDEIIMTKENSFTKNEKKFEQWLLQQYGMTNKEQREYTVKGNLLSLGEIGLSAWGIASAGATKLVVPGKFIARNANNTDEKLYQTVIKSTPMNKPIKVKTNKGIEVEFVNPAGIIITWVEQSPKNILNAIESAKNSKNSGKQIEGKVGDFLKDKVKITNFGLEILNKNKQKVTDIDIQTEHMIIEIKKSASSLKSDQIDRLINPNNPQFFNYDKKEVIVYIDEPIQGITNPETLKKIDFLEKNKVTYVNSLEELEKVIK